MCVVVVEDEPDIRMLVSDLLIEAGHRVVEFGSVSQAKAYCGVPSNELTTLLTDINMPGSEDGLALASYVCATRPEAAVIVTSGRHGGLPAGMPPGIKFLPKPWRASALLAVIGTPAS